MLLIDLTTYLKSLSSHLSFHLFVLFLSVTIRFNYEIKVAVERKKETRNLSEDKKGQCVRDE